MGGAMIAFPLIIRLTNVFIRMASKANRSSLHRHCRNSQVHTEASTDDFAGLGAPQVEKSRCSTQQLACVCGHVRSQI